MSLGEAIFGFSLATASAVGFHVIDDLQKQNDPKDLVLTSILFSAQSMFLLFGTAALIIAARNCVSIFFPTIIKE